MFHFISGWCAFSFRLVVLLQQLLLYKYTAAVLMFCCWCTFLVFFMRLTISTITAAMILAAVAYFAFR